jgi:hypothetical protein
MFYAFWHLTKDPASFALLILSAPLIEIMFNKINCVCIKHNKIIFRLAEVTVKYYLFQNYVFLADMDTLLIEERLV